jgi:hypothetical protein
MLKEKADSILATLTVAAFIILAMYLLIQDVSLVGPL